MITGEIVGRDVGELTRKRLEPGKYLITGPRGSCVLTRETALVYVRSWARSRTVKRTVWNPSECTAEPAWPGYSKPCWALTLRQAIDNLVPVLCSYRTSKAR